VASDWIKKWDLKGSMASCSGAELNAGERGGSWRRFIFFGQSRVSAEEEEGDGMGGGLDYSVLEIICVPLVFRTHGALRE